MIELTPEQHEALKQDGSGPVQAVDRASNLEYVLIRAEAYQRLKALLHDELMENEGKNPAITVPIATFAPEPFELTKEIQAVVQPQDDGYLASFFDANINAFGETQQDAVANLKDMILVLFEELAAVPMEQLGPEPFRQLAILETLIKKAEPCLK